MQDFIVVDTEGKETITEIAIIDAQGQLLFEGFINDGEVQHDTYTLAELLRHFIEYAKDKQVVCHYAEHDEAVLKNSFILAGLAWVAFDFVCTWLLAKKYFPDLSGYALEFLSKSLHLQVNQSYFNPQSAHSARYDALFTAQLYRKILVQKISSLKKPNPFSHTRVDNPFQTYPDLVMIHQAGFERMTTVLDEIRQNDNKQSQGMVILGEAGNGKTHLMMRLAQHILKNNRLFFIRQPNHEDAVFYHIYSRILESFIELVPNTDYSQLEYLLGRSFTKIIINSLRKKPALSKKGKGILDNLSCGQLDIYKLLNADGATKKRQNWDIVERETLNWWKQKYGFGDYASHIIKGLVKYCRYSDIKKRELVRRWLAGEHLEAEQLKSVNLDDWETSLSREEFALQAISVFGKLSIKDQPLIIVFDQLEGLKHHETLLLRFGDAVKELFTHVPNSLILFNLFPDRWQFFQQHFDNSITARMGQHQIALSLPDKTTLRHMLQLKLQTVDIDLTPLFDAQELDIILSHRSIREVLNCAGEYYRYKVENIPLPQNMLSFETRVEQALQALQQEIIELKQHLNIKDTTTPVLQLNPVKQDEIQHYIEQKQQQIVQDYHKKIIIDDSDDLGKLRTVLTGLTSVYNFKLDYLRLGKRKLPEHVVIETQNKKAVIAFLHVDAVSFTTRIKNFNQLVVNHKAHVFVLFRDERQPVIKGKVGKEEIEKLRNASNATFELMPSKNRQHFELIYQIITDIQNHDFNASLDTVIPLLINQVGEKYWLFRALR